MKGSSPDIDEAIRLAPRINNFLKQTLGEASDFATIEARMEELLK